VPTPLQVQNLSMQDETILLVLFNLLVLALLALDLFVFHRKPHAVSLREAAVFSAFWVAISLLFNVGVFHFLGPRAGLEFLTGYLIEKALSVDNIFVFVVIFAYFGVPAKYQHRILFWGVVGALIMRSVFIGAGTALIARFSWVLYVFGVILLYSGFKLLKHNDVEVHPEKNIVIKFVRKIFKHVTTDFDRPVFFFRDAARRIIYITPLFIVLLTIETTDVMFAVDSIPAVFGVTRDPFIVYSSNVFAILGLRALYFLLAGAMRQLEYLGKGLAFVLMFIGVKMLIEDFFHVPIVVSLSVVAGIIGIATVASLVGRRGN
jgi:tellurite resistance protein TerC